MIDFKTNTYESNDIDSATTGNNFNAVEKRRQRIIERRDKVLNAIESYILRQARTEQGMPPVHDLKAALSVLFFDIEAMINRWYSDKKELTSLKTRVASKEYNHLLSAFREINELLDEKKITRIDNAKEYDRTSWKEEVIAKGM